MPRVSAIDASKAPSTTARPKRAKSSPRRRSPSRTAATAARISPVTIAGKRELRTKMRTASSLTSPSRARRIGGMMTPSWKMSTASGESEPGRKPPTSLKCAQLWAKPESFPSAKTGATKTWSGVWLTAPRDA